MSTTPFPIEISGRVKGEDFDLRITGIKVAPRKRPSRKHGISRRSFNRPVRVFVNPVGETLKEQFATRFDRPQRAYKFAARRALEEAFGLKKGQYRITWSQRAGCQCGCSPGFVIRVKGETVALDADDPRRADGFTTVREGLTYATAWEACRRFGDPTAAHLVQAGKFDIFVDVEGADAEGVVTDRALERLRALADDADLLTDAELANLEDNEDMFHEHREPEWRVERNALRGIYATGGRVIA